LDVLRYCLPSSVRGILNELPKSLDETYERILRGIKGPNQRHAHRLLQCLVAAVRPLRVDELSEVLAFDFDEVDAEGIPKINPDWRRDSQEDQEEAIMSACSDLVTLVDGNYWQRIRTVRFSHFSVKEFLTSNRLAESTRDVSRYHIRLDAAHTTLVRTCLGMFLQLNDRLINTTPPPLAHYAAVYWVTHARFEDVTSRIRDAIRCLFDTDKPHFATWCGLLPKGRLTYSARMDDRPLFYAASFGFRDAVEHIVVQHPERINAKGQHGLTPLHVAAMNGFADIVSLLLEHGADVAAQDNCDMTPLLQASLEGKLEAGRCLLDHGADVNCRSESYDMTPVCAAVRAGHVEFARILLERGAVMDSRSWFINVTPLIGAVRSKDIQMVRLLLEYGEDVNECDRNGVPFTVGVITWTTRDPRTTVRVWCQV
jgi:Ankyrin repeats (3 copies)